MNGPRLSARYSAYDALSIRVRTHVVACRLGVFKDRLQTVHALQRALLAGRLPSADTLAWPEPWLRKALLQTLRDAEAPQKCRNSPELTERTLLTLLDTANDCFFTNQQTTDEIVRLLLPSLCQLPTPEKRVERARELLTQAQWEEVQRNAQRLAHEHMLERARNYTHCVLQQHFAIRDRLRALLGKLVQTPAGVAGLFDGALQLSLLEELLQLEKALQFEEQLNALIEQLGRKQASPTAPLVELETHGTSFELPQPTRQKEERSNADRSGIARGGEFERMLPNEALSLLHPSLRLLWHARRIERSLMLYEATDELEAQRSGGSGGGYGPKQWSPRPVRGPVLLLLDTSGSMCGAPETIAKTVVLRVASLAHEEGRACYLYNFSGPSNVLEQPISKGARGYADILSFLSTSFHGGTVPDEALRRSCEKLSTEEFRHADVVMVSDGYFELSDAIARELRALQATRGTRFHGVRTGMGFGMHSFCEHIHDTLSLLHRSKF